jgi:GDP-L-fucose synthase
MSIAAIAAKISEVVGYQGKTVWDDSKPDGTPRKLLDVSRLMALGWSPRITLEDGLRNTVDWFLSHQTDVRS